MHLNNIAKNLRENRFKNGCMKLEQPKLNFVLNKTTGLPAIVNVYEQKDSNKLVEEFMLLANIAAAQKIYEKYSAKALLKRHSQPKAQKIQDLEMLIRAYNYNCDFKTSGSIEVYYKIKQKSFNILTLIFKFIQVIFTKN